MKNYWAEKAKKIKGVKLYTSTKPQYSCALATVGIEGMKPRDIESNLYKDYKIHCTTIEHEEVFGVRITPHVYTSIEELDLLVEAIEDLANRS